MKTLYLILAIVLISLASCKKCKECYVDETKTSTGQTKTSSLGEFCGKEIEAQDGKTYKGSDGPVKIYCK